jgi:hypothetical protein
VDPAVSAKAASVDVAGEFARIRAAHRSPLAAVFAVADWMAAMPANKRPLANPRAMHAEIRRLLDDAVAERELLKCDTNRLADAVQSLITGALLQWAIDHRGKVGERLRADLDTLLKPRHCPPRERRRHPRRPVRRT